MHRVPTNPSVVHESTPAKWHWSELPVRVKVIELGTIKAFAETKWMVFNLNVVSSQVTLYLNLYKRNQGGKYHEWLCMDKNHLQLICISLSHRRQKITTWIPWWTNVTETSYPGILSTLKNPYNKGKHFGYLRYWTVGISASLWNMLTYVPGLICLLIRWLYYLFSLYHQFSSTTKIS